MYSLLLRSHASNLNSPVCRLLCPWVGSRCAWRLWLVSITVATLGGTRPLEDVDDEEEEEESLPDLLCLSL